MHYTPKELPPCDHDECPPTALTRIQRTDWLDIMKTQEIQIMQDRAEGLNVYVDPLDRLPKNASKEKMLEAVEQIEGMLFREECDRQGAVEALKAAIENS